MKMFAVWPTLQCFAGWHALSAAKGVDYWKFSRPSLRSERATSKPKTDLFYKAVLTRFHHPL
jgi:hypothetical protein